MSVLTKVYEEIALERDHVCTGCGTKYPLSHSHLVPRGQNKKLEAIKENIQYHCLSIGEKKGCHSLWESIEFWTLDDAYQNMVYIFKADPTYFWLKINHAYDAYYQLVKKDPVFPTNKEERKRKAEFTRATEALDLLKKIAA